MRRLLFFVTLYSLLGNYLICHISAKDNKDNACKVDPKKLVDYKEKTEKNDEKNDEKIDPFNICKSDDKGRLIRNPSSKSHQIQSKTTPKDAQIATTYILDILTEISSGIGGTHELVENKAKKLAKKLAIFSSKQFKNLLKIVKAMDKIGPVLQLFSFLIGHTETDATQSLIISKFTSLNKKLDIIHHNLEGKFMKVLVAQVDIVLDGLLGRLSAIDHAYKDYVSAADEKEKIRKKKDKATVYEKADSNAIFIDYEKNFRKICNTEQFQPMDIFQRLYGHACEKCDKGSRGLNRGLEIFAEQSFHEGDMSKLEEFKSTLSFAMVETMFLTGVCLQNDIDTCLDPCSDPILKKKFTDMKDGYEEVAKNFEKEYDKACPCKSIHVTKITTPETAGKFFLELHVGKRFQQIWPDGGNPILVDSCNGHKGRKVVNCCGDVYKENGKIKKCKQSKYRSHGVDRYDCYDGSPPFFNHVLNDNICETENRKGYHNKLLLNSEDTVVLDPVPVTAHSLGRSSIEFKMIKEDGEITTGTIPASKWYRMKCQYGASYKESLDIQNYKIHFEVRDDFCSSEGCNNGPCKENQYCDYSIKGGTCMEVREKDDTCFGNSECKGDLVCKTNKKEGKSVCTSCEGDEINPHKEIHFHKKEVDSCSGWDCDIIGSLCPEGKPGAGSSSYCCGTNRKWEEAVHTAYSKKYCPSLRSQGKRELKKKSCGCEYRRVSLVGLKRKESEEKKTILVKSFSENGDFNPYVGVWYDSSTTKWNKNVLEDSDTTILGSDGEWKPIKQTYEQVLMETNKPGDLFVYVDNVVNTMIEKSEWYFEGCDHVPKIIEHAVFWDSSLRYVLQLKIENIIYPKK